MRIWIVSEFYKSLNDTVGGYYVNGLAEKLASTENVEVVFPSNNSKPSIDPKNKININHIRQFRFNRKNLVTRTVAQLIMSVQFLFFLLPRVKKDDIVVSFTHPAFIIFTGIFLKKMKKTKIVIVNYDLFPEILVATGSSKENWVYRSVQKMFNKAYNEIDTIISLGDDMTRIFKNKIQNKSTKIYTIPNWADVDSVFFQTKETNDIILKYNLESKIVFSYAGSIGRCQGIDRLLDLIDRSDFNGNIHFLFFGKGVAINSFQEQILKNRNQQLITYAGFIYTEDRKLITNACDVAIISLLDGMTGLCFPSKTYNIMASGHPILFVGKEDSDIAKMISKYNIGWVCSSSDSNMFQNTINEILENPCHIKIKGEKARKVAEQYFAKDDVLNRYLEALKI
jgi:glycosyltransferase involved in cell wall biosynthesis